jgi:response regulator RpfG family c-di-GMP phosphodiesterase
MSTPYRAAWSDERALTYLQSGSGKSFDPRVVAGFFRLIACEKSETGRD